MKKERLPLSQSEWVTILHMVQKQYARQIGDHDETYNLRRKRILRRLKDLAYPKQDKDVV